MPSDGLILGFDTSAALCAAALLSGTRVLAERVEPMARGQAERLMPLLQEVLEDAGAGWGDLTRIGVGIGPGNFTGIRIAVSAARGLSLGLGIPAVGVDTLHAAALDAPRPALATVPATGGRFYLGRFDAAGAMTAETLAPEDMPKGPILSYAPD
ncbi:MAG: tRNA (adenosine(37)-N6)-threonylcarbamoyltransferase complex dimerization subunit type 1 TsaB, partial [Pseudomonadota bacterium]|nr:tRNA (adenosine(37)-N6)-threonylcarbamoyltransferase complex dimerization subunit type 1 TsaB [Pseudomonadota bacterium]